MNRNHLTFNNYIILQPIIMTTSFSLAVVVVTFITINCINCSAPNWQPLPDSEAEDSRMVHGIHCSSVVEECINKDINQTENDKIKVDDNEMNVMHCYHCQRLMLLTKRFQDANPDFEVSDDLCSIIPESRVKRLTLHNLLYARKRRSISQIETDMQFILLQASELGELLLKDYKGQHLTPNEAKYLQQIENQNTVMGAARGLYCKKGSKSSKEFVADLVKRSHGICW